MFCAVVFDCLSFRLSYFDLHRTAAHIRRRMNKKMFELTQTTNNQEREYTKIYKKRTESICINKAHIKNHYHSIRLHIHVEKEYDYAIGNILNEINSNKMLKLLLFVE